MDPFQMKWICHYRIIKIETSKRQRPEMDYIGWARVLHEHATNNPYSGPQMNIKGIFRDHSHNNALNFHKIRDFCILVMALDV